VSQHFNIFLNDFRSSIKSFNRLLSIGMVFALFGHFYIVEPYFRYTEGKRKILAKESQLKKGYETLNRKFIRVHAIRKEIDENLINIENEIQKFPTKLRENLQKIQRIITIDTSSSTSVLQSDLSIDGMTLPEDINKIEEGVEWYIKKWLENLAAKIKKSLSELDKKLEEIGITVTNDLDILIQNSVKEFEAFIDNIDMDFWRHYETGKVRMSREMEKNFEKQFLPIRNKLSEWVNSIKKDEEKRKEEIQNKKNEIDELIHKINNLNSKIQSIESPVGKIPLDLTDFIRIFPLLIVILFVLLTLRLQKTKRIQHTLSNEIEKNHKPKKEDEERFNHQHQHQYFTACWFLPSYQNRFQAIILKIALLIFFSIFLRSIWLIIEGPRLFSSIFMKQLPIDTFVFFAFYALGTLVIIVCLWFIQRSLKKKETSGLIS